MKKARCQRKLAAVLVLLGGCATTPPERPDTVSQAGEFDEAWSAYLNQYDLEALQPDCRPRRVDPAPGQTYRGTAVFFHGFSACPQQFFELADLLAETGWRTLIPLLPGHGLMFADQRRDDFSQLPTSRNWEQAYGRLADEINSIMSLATGERVVGGLSVGGTTALFVNLRAPDLYARHLIFAPFFEPGASQSVNAVIGSGTRTPGANRARVKPFAVKDPCLDRRAQGRAGMCNYELRHVGAINALGSFTLKALKENPLPGALQVAGAENDGVVSNDATREFLSAQRQQGRISACFYPDGTPHAMISPFDNPGIDMYWLETLRKTSLDFVDAGMPFPTSGEVSEAEAPWETCDVPGTGDSSPPNDEQFVS